MTRSHAIRSKRVAEVNPKLLSMTCGGSNSRFTLHLVHLMCCEPTEEEEAAYPASMMLGSHDNSIEDLLATIKSFVWQHFGYPAEIQNSGRV